MIVFDEWLEVWGTLVDMLNCLIDSVLANIFTWELESILVCYLKRNCIVAIIHLLKCKLFKVSDKSVPDVSLWHIKCRVLVEFFEFFHHHEAKVLVADVEDEAWSALVDALWDVGLHQEIVDLVAVAGVVLVDQVEGVPLEVEVLVDGLALPESVEGLVEEHVHIQVECLVEALLLHVLPSISKEVQLSATLLLQCLNNL